MQFNGSILYACAVRQSEIITITAIKSQTSLRRNAGHNIFYHKGI